MRIMHRSLLLVGLAGLVALLVFAAACGGGTTDNGDNGGTTTTTGDTDTGNGSGEQPTPRPTNTPAAPTRIEGVPEPEEWDGSEGIAATESDADMTAYGADGLGGTLHLIQIERKTKVTVVLDDAGPGPFAAAVRRGGCPDEGAEAGGQFDYLLFDVEDGESVSMVNTPAQFFQFSLAYVVVVGGTDLINDPVVSCGNIPSPLR